MIPAPAHLNPHLTGLVHPASVFVADFLPVAPGFHHRTHHVRLRNFGTIEKNLLTKSGTERFRENIRQKERENFPCHQKTRMRIR